VYKKKIINYCGNLVAICGNLVAICGNLWQSCGNLWQGKKPLDTMVILFLFEKYIVSLDVVVL
jgi:hypothetical protein